MEKSYRDLFDTLSARAGDSLLTLIQGVGCIDDLDPMQCPALRAMKGSPPPPLNLLYVLQDGVEPTLSLCAENPARKRKAAAPSLCARLVLPRWCCHADEPFPDESLATRTAYLDLIQRSFGYLSGRIGIYFAVQMRNTLVVATDAVPVLRLIEHTPNPTQNSNASPIGDETIQHLMHASRNLASRVRSQG